MLVTADVIAMNPSTLLSIVAPWADVIRIAPTTEIAEIAFVKDISGVCSSGETLRITSSPRNVANMNTQTDNSKFDGISIITSILCRRDAETRRNR
jgi:hypothetical protein